MRKIVCIIIAMAIVIVLSFYMGLNTYKFSPLWIDKVGLKTGETFNYLSSQWYDDKQNNQRFYFRTVYKNHAEGPSGDKKYLIITLLYEDKNVYEGRHLVIKPSWCTWRFTNWVRKIFMKPPIEYEEDRAVSNEFGDYLILRLDDYSFAYWKKENETPRD